METTERQLTKAEMNRIILDLVIGKREAAVVEVIRRSSEVAAEEATERLTKEYEERDGYGFSGKFAMSDEVARRRAASVDRAKGELTRWDQVLHHTMHTFIEGV